MPKRNSLLKTTIGALCLAGTVFANPIASAADAAGSIVDQALSALGGEQPLRDLKGITYNAPNIFRSRSLMQSYEMDRADTALAITGSQNISFLFTTDELVQRIDREFIPSDYWTWASPRLDRMGFSLVTKGGDDGFSCYVQGNNQIWLPPDITSGYNDPALSEYFVLHGIMMSPKLLLQIKAHNETKMSSTNVAGVTMPSVYDPSLNLTVVFDPVTSFPYIVRAIEEHSVYGECTNDLVLTNYTKETETGLYFPSSIRTVYNASSTNLYATLEDFYVESVITNPKFPDNFFDGIPDDQSFIPKAAPHEVAGISHARLTEFNSNMVYSGIPNTTVDDIKSERPVAGLPQVHWLIVDESFLGVKQMVIEFEHEVIMSDAAPQWSLNAIQWVKKNIGKPIAYVFPTHHHRDHSGGVPDYVAAGAKLIVPEMSREYWANIPDAEIITFNDTHPYIHRDSQIQAWFMWEEQAAHSADWAYAFVTTLCPEPDSPSVVFEADVWHGGAGLMYNDQVLMRQWLDQIQGDGLSRNATVFPTHGQVKPLTDLIAEAGYAYPDLMTTDWKKGAAVCQ